MRRALALTLLALLLNGCALTTEQIDISYAPQDGVAVIAGADRIVVDVQVNDQRNERSARVSCKKNGFGMEMAAINANEDVTATIRRAMEQELQARGFTIGKEAIVSISADLYRFWNDHRMGFFAGDAVADLSMSVSVRDKAGAIIYTNSIHVQGIEENTQLMTGNNARLALNKALENGMKKLFDDQAFVGTLLAVSSKNPS